MISSVYKLSIAIAKSRFQVFVLLIMIDIGNVIYLRSRYLSKFMSPSYLKSLFRTIRPDLNFDPYVLNELQAVMATSFSGMLLFFILFNTVMYYLYLKEKVFGIKFVKGYALMAVIFSLIEFFSYLDNFSLWFIYLLITTVMYLGIYLRAKEELNEKN